MFQKKTLIISFIKPMDGCREVEIFKFLCIENNFVTRFRNKRCSTDLITICNKKTYIK